jgi:hypothetical protein
LGIRVDLEDEVKKSTTLSQPEKKAA